MKKDNTRVRVVHADCMTVLKKMEDNSVDLTIADIPYGEVNRKSNGLRNLNKGKADILTFDLNEFVDEVCRVTRGSVYIFCGTLQISQVLCRMRENGLSTRQCIWQKSNPSPMNGRYIFLSGIENIAFGKKSGATFNESCKSPVFRYPCGRSKIHPTQKPVDLIKELILASSNEGDTVFDPCMGSGTALVAARSLKRNSIGVELDEQWFHVACERLGFPISHFERKGKAA